MNRYTYDDIFCAFDDEDLETREFVKASDVEDLAGDAQTLRGYIKTHGETPAMTWSNREHWKKRAELAEAANGKLVAALKVLSKCAKKFQLETDEKKRNGRIWDALYEAIEKADAALSPPSSWPTNEAESAALAGSAEPKQ